MISEPPAYQASTLYEPSAQRQRAPSGICLNMIVKDETAVLERLFASVHEVIDTFVIVDTGSSDGTPDLIVGLAEEYRIPGEIHYRPWVNFGHNRQQALDLAVAAERGDWILFLDADDELGCHDVDWYRSLEPGRSYRLEKRHDDIRYSLNNLIWWRGRRWRWQGVIHEALSAEPPLLDAVQVKDAWIIHHTGQGGRSQGVSLQEKYRRDAELLERAVKADPADARARFYLAQSWRDAGEPAIALEHYRKRAAMGGWSEEVYVAQCEQLKLMMALGHDPDAIARLAIQAFSERPQRAEALWLMARYCRQQQRYGEGLLFARAGRDLERPVDDVLFVQEDVYRWRLLDEYQICAYWAGCYQESVEAGQALLARKAHPPAEQDRLRRNLDFAMDKLSSG